MNPKINYRKIKKIIFICKYNRFRSRIAESYFKKINKNPRIEAESAGLIKGTRLDKEEIKFGKKLGLDIRGIPRGLSEKILDASDILIVVADNVPKKNLIKRNIKRNYLFGK